MEAGKIESTNCPRWQLEYQFSWLPSLGAATRTFKTLPNDDDTLDICPLLQSQAIALHDNSLGVCRRFSHPIKCVWSRRSNTGREPIAQEGGGGVNSGLMPGS